MNFLRSFKKRIKIFKSCEETFVNLIAFYLLSTVLNTSFRTWRQSLSIPSSIFQEIIAWNENFGTGGSVIITPFGATKNAAILFTFCDPTIHHTADYEGANEIWRSMSVAGQSLRRKVVLPKTLTYILFSVLEKYVCDSCTSRNTEILQWWLIIWVFL